MSFDDLVRQRAHPVEERPAHSAPDQREVVLVDELGDHLVVTRRRRMFDRLDHQPPLAQPSRGVRSIRAGASGSAR